MVEAVQNVLEAENHEAERGLKPTRVESHQPRSTRVLVDALRPSRGHESQHRDGAQAEMSHLRIDRELRLVGGNRDLEEYVQQSLRRRQVDVRIERRRPHARQRGLVAGERAVTGQRNSCCHELERGQSLRAFVQPDVVPDPLDRGIMNQRVGLGDLQVARVPHGKVEFTHRE